MSEDWISAREAWDLVSGNYSHGRDAEIAIYRYAKEAKIATKVKVLSFLSNFKKIEHFDIDVSLAFWDSMLLEILQENFLRARSESC